MSLFGKAKSSSSNTSSALKGNRKLVAYSLGIVVSILIMIVLFNFESTQTLYEKEHANVANSQKVLSQQIATFALNASLGDPVSFVQLKRLQARFENSLLFLKDGDVERGVPGIPL